MMRSSWFGPHRLLQAGLLFALLFPATGDAARRHHKRAIKARPQVVPPVIVVQPAAAPAWGPVRKWNSPGVRIEVGPPPRPGWVYVPGYWRAGVWIGGFWRPALRVGFRWVEVPAEAEVWPGYWEPEGEGPEGMVWRPGYWDGSVWVEGGWVPAGSLSVYGDDGELRFLGVGDGQVESLALPAREELILEEESLPVEAEGDDLEGELRVKHHDPPW